MSYERPIQTRFYIGDVVAYDSPDDLDAGLPTVLDDFTIPWGKSSGSPVDQPDAATFTFNVRQQILPGSTDQPRMLDYIHIGSQVGIEVTGNGRTASVWSGQVTNVVSTIVGDHAWQTAVTVSNAATEPANDDIGDGAWRENTVGARVQRIARLAKGEPPIVVDPTLAGYKLTYRDVDNQPVLGLLQEIATSVGATLWIVEDKDQGAYFWMEDAGERTPVRKFFIDGDRALTIGDNEDDELATIDSADLLQEPLTISQDVTTLITAVDFSWQQQTVGDDGVPAPTEQIISLVDDDGYEKYRLHKLSIDSQLSNKQDALEFAQGYLDRSRASDWSFTGLELDTRILNRQFDVPGVERTDEFALIMDLLDGKTRLAKAITPVDLPTYLPESITAAIYVEGGEYTWSNGWWSLSLVAFPAGRQGRSTRFEEMREDVALEDADTDIALEDCQGVAPPEENEVYATATDDVVVNNSTDPTTTQLSVNLDQNTIYEIEVFLAYNSPTAADMSLRWVTPAGSTMLWSPNGPAGNASYPTNVWNLNTAAAGDNPTIGGAGQAIAIHPSGMITTGGVGGMLTLQFSQKTATAADTTVLKGSWIKATKVGKVDSE